MRPLKELAFVQKMRSKIGPCSDAKIAEARAMLTQGPTPDQIRIEKMMTASAIYQLGTFNKVGDDLFISPTTSTQARNAMSESDTITAANLQKRAQKTLDICIPSQK